MVKKLALVLLVLGVSVLALEAQTSTLQLTGSPPAVLYDPNWGSRYTMTGTITVTRTTTYAGDPFTIDLMPVSTARNVWFYNGNPSDTITITATNSYVTASGKPNNRDIAKAWGVETGLTNYNVWRGSFSAGETSKTFNYYVNFRHDTVLAHGIYQFINTFRLRAETFVANSQPTTPVIDTVPLANTVVVGTAVFLNFQDANGLPIDKIEFLETSTMTKDFSILAQVNFVYKLSVISSNFGILKHSEYPTVPDTISYNLWVVNMTTVVPLRTGLFYIVQNQPKSRAAPASYNARVQIDFNSLENYTAGKYSDILTFKVEAQ